jgi:osmoprotectant transport system ATP-binding protein
MPAGTLELKDIHKSYAEQAVLSRLSMRFTPGAVTAVIGPSGCGKSTLLRLCNALELPDHGSVHAFGVELGAHNARALRRRMGYAVQGSALFPHLNARDNICLPARAAGWARERIQGRLEALLQLARIDRELLPRYPHQLSGGQQQRVGLARAMLLEPDVLLLDEPFAAIDPITRLDIHRQLLELLAVEPTTVVLITHDMHEAMRLAEHIAVLDHGRLQWHGPRSALQAQLPGLPAEELLLRLLREPPAARTAAAAAEAAAEAAAAAAAEAEAEAKAEAKAKAKR